MSLELKFYTDDKNTRELCTHYWQLGEAKSFCFKVGELSKTYNLTGAAIRKLVNDSCTAYSVELSCIQCGSPRTFVSRTDYLENSRDYSWGSWICDICIDTAEEEKEKKKLQQEQLRFDLVNDEYLNRCKDGLHVTNLSFSNAIYLLSAIRTGSSEDLTYIVPREYYNVPLSPHFDYDLEILRQLYHDGVLCIHPESRKETIELAQDGAPDSFQFYPVKVHWLLPLSENQKAGHVVEELENTLSSQNWPSSWASEVVELRSRVALEESLQYLRYVLSEHGFEFTVGEKTIQVVKSLLNAFAVAQIYNFCWRAARDAAAFYMRKEVSKQHAANTVPGSIQKMSERAILEKWDVKPYGRHFKVPQCMVSQVLYNTALKIGEAGFNEPVPK